MFILGELFSELIKINYINKVEDCITDSPVVIKLLQITTNNSFLRAVHGSLDTTRRSQDVSKSDN